MRTSITSVLTLVGALALPVVAIAHGTRTTESTSRETSPRSETRTSNEGFPLTLQHIDTVIRQPIADGCEYVATARGSYRSHDIDGSRPEDPLRNVDIYANASLSCRGVQIRNVSRRFVFPTLASRGQLADMLHANLAASVPGSQCSWSPSFAFVAGHLQASSIANNCDARESRTALSAYQPRGQAVVDYQRQVQQGAIPSRNFPPLPLGPLSEPNPPLDTTQPVRGGGPRK